MRTLAKGGSFLAKVAVVLLVVGLFALPTLAQVPKVEVFGGFQYDRFEGTNLKGWDAAVTGDVNKWFGIAGDFSGAYLSGGHIYKYMGGPVISMDKEGRISPFVHFLVGGFRLSGEGTVNGFALAPGGGIDVKASKHVAIRVAQFDWILMHATGGWSNKNFRYSAGIVFRF
jgi:hypothetical protein